MKIAVTQEHIDKGIRKSADCCPVALAIDEVLPDECFSRVEGSFATVIEPGTDWHMHYELPTKVELRIRHFDEGKGMEPFSFELTNEEEKLV